MNKLSLITFISFYLYLGCMASLFAYDKNDFNHTFDHFRMTNSTLINELNQSLDNILELQTSWDGLHKQDDPFKFLNGINSMIVDLKGYAYSVFYHQEQLENQYNQSFDLAHEFKYSHRPSREQEIKDYKHKQIFLNQIGRKVYQKAKNTKNFLNRDNQFYIYFDQLKQFKDKLNQYKSSQMYITEDMFVQEQRQIKEQLMIAREVNAILKEMLLLIQVSLSRISK